MLAPWIIEEIRRREEEERRHRERAMEIRIETPRDPAERDGRSDSTNGGSGGGKQPGEERGVVVIDFSV